MKVLLMFVSSTLYLIMIFAQLYCLAINIGNQTIFTFV